MIQSADISPITACHAMSLLDRAICASISAISAFALFAPLF